MLRSKSQLPLEQQMKMLFFDGKPGCMAMLMWSYLDESSDQFQQKAFVAAGFMAPVKGWTALRKPWQKKLKEHRIDYFKASECRNLQGEFHKYRRELGLVEGKKKALLVRDDLESLIRDSSVVGFAMGVNLADFHEVNAMPEAKVSTHWNPDFEDSAFQLLIHALMTRLHTDFGGNYQVGFIHDESNSSNKLKNSYGCFKKRHPALAARMRNFTSRDDTRHPPLQMADLMADVARDVINRKIDNPDFDIFPRDGVQGSVYVIDCWQKWGMLRLVKGQTATLNISPCPSSECEGDDA